MGLFYPKNMSHKRIMSAELRKLQDRIEQYKMKEVVNKDYLNWMEGLESAIRNYYQLRESESKSTRFELSIFLEPYIEVIRKQAMIIDAAGIVYPTINQSMGLINNIYQQQKGLPVSDQIETITINTI